MAKKIVIITTGQPSTNPRMIKEYQALKEEGYIVKVFYSFWANWANAADTTLFDSGQINKEDFILVGGSRIYQNWKYNYSRFRRKLCKILSFQPKEYSFSRTAFFLEQAALKEKADLYIAHNVGALSSAVKAAKKYNAKVGFDAEDYHRGEFRKQEAQNAKVVKFIEDKYLPQCHYITAASPLIFKAYKTLYPFVKVTAINNVFSKKYLQKLPEESIGILKLFWFSQTVGPNRGLETAVKAIEILKDTCHIQLHLMGKVSAEYASDLIKLTTCPNSIFFMPPVAPDAIFAEASKFDVGLSLEVPEPENRDFCLTNKIFTYLLAGNCIIFSDTKAQTDFFNSFPAIGFLYRTDDVTQLSEILLHLYYNKSDLNNKKQNSLRLASEHLNWENESRKFKVLIKEQLER